MRTAPQEPHPSKLPAMETGSQMHLRDPQGGHSPFKFRPVIGAPQPGHSPHQAPGPVQGHNTQTYQQPSYKPFVRLRAPQPTHAVYWFAAACCALLWIAVILGGFAVLVIFLVYRPRNPRLEISSVTLNGAYLDTGKLLNADITVLANFSNPNRKADVSFGYMQLDLYYRGTMIATQAVAPFTERRGESVLRSVHMVSSQVELPEEAASAWKSGAMGDGVAIEVEGAFRTRLVLGGWLRYKYWLHRRCNIFVRGPPNGALVSSRCSAKH